MAVMTMNNMTKTDRICDSVLDAIGRTPMVRMTRFAEKMGVKAQLVAKVEFTNPAGSVKDRVAVAMIRDAEEKGLLKPGGTIIEATAGNTGLGLAMAAAVLGYRTIFVMPDKMSKDKIDLLKAYGAEVVVTPTAVPPDSPESYNGVANRLAREIKGAWRPNQFGNQANPRCHYEWTGPEIWEQTQGRITHFISGAGTGGTLSGVGRYLKDQNPEVKVIGADIAGSILSGDSPKPWKVEGIGEDFVPSTLDATVVDEWIRVTDQESFSTARMIARTEGLLFGGSTGTAFSAAVKLAGRLGPHHMVVVIAPDTGRNYISKFYNDEWMAECGFGDRLPERTTVGDVLKTLEQRKIVFVRPDESLHKAVELTDNHAISQLPVLDEGGRMIGSVEEITVMKSLHEGLDLVNTKVRDIMARPLPEVDKDVIIDEAYRLLMAGHPGLVVADNGHPMAILTRSDLVRYWEKTPRKS